ncbi:Rap1a/Tai family immunity protein [Aeromonas caviae]|uniref:Rap1a/Tai family immunity protein n=1 Tax=Aeromonas caviae TaxID=648 RepID=UPI002B247B0A|nr:Rap1a/Tai family immunity protein [Aeromonas caviae]MEA9426253.1 Rap1a/Tai family immunity protein [Aeromonas caviae]MEA9431143.1 Rap1a/Tai family immunity protein [Aeromonas caviae]
MLLIMFQRLFIIAFLLYSACVSAGFNDGNALFNACSNGDGYFKEGQCLGYVTGVFDSYEDTYICAPNHVTAGQAKDIVVKYLAEHPGKRHEPAAFLVGLALMDVFPCKKS